MDLNLNFFLIVSCIHSPTNTALFLNQTVLTSSCQKRTPFYDETCFKSHQTNWYRSKGPARVYDALFRNQETGCWIVHFTASLGGRGESCA